jgi:hypothetical protein
VLHECEGQLDRDGEERDQQGPGEEPLVVVDARTVVDVPPQASPPDDRGECRRRHHRDRRRPDAGHDQRGRQRHLHTAQHLAATHAHAARGVDRLGIDAGHPCVGVRDHRRDRERDEHEERRDGSDADRLHPRRWVADAELAHGEQQQGERGQRAPDVGDVDGHEPARAAMAEEQPDRERDQDRHDDRDHTDLDVLPQQVWDPLRARPVVAVVEPVEGGLQEAHVRPPRSDGSRG